MFSYSRDESWLIRDFGWTELVVCCRLTTDVSIVLLEVDTTVSEWCIDLITANLPLNWHIFMATKSIYHMKDTHSNCSQLTSHSSTSKHIHSGLCLIFARSIFTLSTSFVDFCVLDMATNLQITVTTNHLQQFECRFDVAALIQMICTYEQLNFKFRAQVC